MTERRIVALITVVVALSIAGPAYVWLGAGRSQAAFGDAEALGVNRLGAAVLDVAEGAGSVALAADAVAPGDRFDGSIVVTNEGTLALSYQVTFHADVGAGLDAAEVLGSTTWTLATTDQDCIRSVPVIADATMSAGEPMTIFDSPGGPTRPLLPGESETICVTGELSIDAPNSAQGATVRIDVVLDAVHDVAATEAATGTGP